MAYVGRVPKPAPSAFERAVTLLAARARTRASLEAALLARGHAEGDVSAALVRVAALGYLDDGRVAAAKAESLLGQGWAPAAVESKLEALGVSSTQRQAALAQAKERLGYAELEAAQSLLRKRGLSGPKAARLLSARGFDEALAARLSGVDEGEG